MQPLQLLLKRGGMYRMMADQAGLQRGEVVVIIDIAADLSGVFVVPLDAWGTLKRSEMCGATLRALAVPLVPAWSSFVEVDHGRTFPLMRKQFPLRPAFGSTIDACQGRTLTALVWDASYAPFSHGQAFVALTRARDQKGLRILVRKNQKFIANCVNDSVREWLLRTERAATWAVRRAFATTPKTSPTIPRKATPTRQKPSRRTVVKPTSTRKPIPPRQGKR